MAARTIRSWRGAWILGIGLLGVAGTAGAQQNAERRPEATRAELEALWAKISPEQRSYAEAVALRERLDQGDFQVGDKVVLHVQGDTSLSREFTVNATRGLDLPNIGEVPLLGVLHSELTDHLRTVMARYIKSVDLRAESLIRIAASGQLTRPGFYNVSAASVLGDVFTAAGGLTSVSDLSKTEIRRGGQVFMSAKQVQAAITDGLTLDRMNLHSGDELQVGEKTRGSTTNTVLLIGAIAGAILSIVAVASLVK